MSGSAIHLEARPAPIKFDADRTASLVIDMQNDFAARGGMFDRFGLDIEIVRRAIAPTARALLSIRKAGIPVIYLKMACRPDLSDMGPPGSPNHEIHSRFGVGNAVTDPTGKSSCILIRDTWNTQVIDELKPMPGDVEIYKHRYSGFFETELHDVLKQRAIKWLIVTGCTTSVCVESTIRDAMFRDYTSILLEDCTAEVIGSDLHRTNHQASLLVVETLFGAVTTSDHLIAALAQCGRSAA